MNRHALPFPSRKQSADWKAKSPDNRLHPNRYTKAGLRLRHTCFYPVYKFLLAGALGISLISGTSASAHPLKIATWNMDWLVDNLQPPTQPLPSDIPHRSATDFTALAGYADALDADIIGVQEVDGISSLSRVFPASRYQLFLSNDPITQHTGAAIRKGLTVTRNPDVTDIAVSIPGTVHPLRSGLDLTVHEGSTILRLLVVHLKTGCWDNPPEDRKHACPTLVLQFKALGNWISARQKANDAFLVMGDFNRRLTVHDPFFLSILQSGPLRLSTAGQANPCEGGTYFIDHILLGGPATHWEVKNSLRVLMYQPADPAALSDHCPVSLRLDPSVK
ncbi:endonuclease/exonuclease/phosphatase family protein [Acetobacter tropicalis]|uniref:endonuclease/exonuclease/phosphatase family protein n=1 Tax=Acetobacter tropicalis TaxID=104102 RepID=UPI0020CD8153|nr:endonuclease/exonuclease/phosphatase family protein [Acetobacter tropicalis]